nr:unnamed protein product [Callosobruchus analis]
MEPFKKFPYHTQDIERCVKLVMEVSSAVCGQVSRDGFIRGVTKNYGKILLKHNMQLKSKLSEGITGISTQKKAKAANQNQLFQNIVFQIFSTYFRATADVLARLKCK